MTYLDCDSFTRAYIDCALWSSTYGDNGTHHMDDGKHELASETIAQMVADCRTFRAENISLAGLDEEQCGHDFWLTRNYHGAGFWDRGLGKVGQRLTDAAHAYAECDLYVGDDGLIYLE